MDFFTHFSLCNPRVSNIGHGSKKLHTTQKQFELSYQSKNDGSMHKAHYNNWGNSNNFFEPCLVLGTTEYTSLFILWLKTGTFMGIGSAACFLVCSKKRDQSFLKKKYIFYSKTDPLNYFHSKEENSMA